MNLVKAANDIKNAVQTYSDKNFSLLLVLFILVYQLVKRNNRGLTFLWKYSFLAFLVLLNPFSYQNIKVYGLDESEYSIVFYVIPITFIVAYFITLIVIGTEKNNIWKICLVFVVVLFASVNCRMSMSGWNINTNRVKIDNEMFELEKIMENAGVGRILAPENVTEQLSEIPNNLYFWYGSDVINGELVSLNDSDIWTTYFYAQQIQENRSDIEMQLVFARENGCDCLIVEKDFDKNFHNEYQVIKLGETKKYVVYHI